MLGRICCFAGATVAILSFWQRKTGRATTGSPEKEATGTGEICPGCGQRVPDLRRHMKRCCPEQLPERSVQDAEERRAARKAASEEDWISQEEVRDAALKSFAAVQDPLHRRALELRFGADRGGLRRTPAEVAEALGGKYIGKSEAALNLIRTALRSIPLVADDPKDLVVIHEDESLLAVSKPPCLRCTPVHRFVGKSLTNQILGYLQLNGEGQHASPMMLHRLDQTTSGIVLCAKTKAAAKACGEQWHEDDCKKEYLAIALADSQCQLRHVGEAAVVDAPIGPDPLSDDPVRRAINMDDGQSAATRFEVLATGVDGSLLLACRLERSGRTHQIRVHANHIGASLLGDEMYGGSRVASHPAATKRVALHAWRFRAPHPSRPETLHLEAPLPPDLQNCLRQLRVQWTATAWH